MTRIPLIHRHPLTILSSSVTRSPLPIYYVDLSSTRPCHASIITHRKEPDLPQLSSLGHFLKGSSAALGVIRVQDACEKIQHYGNCRDEEAGKDLGEEEALKLIGKLLEDTKKDYDVAKGWLSRLYPDA